MIPRRSRLVVACIIGWNGPLQPKRSCDPPTADGPSRDLYCIELVPAPSSREASGRVELGHLPGPFTIAVTPDGRPRHAPAVTIAGLPTPAALGPFTTYVAW